MEALNLGFQGAKLKSTNRERMTKKILLFLALSLLLAPLKAEAAPTADQARSLVERIISYSLQAPVSGAAFPAEWDALRPHKADFDPEFFSALQWVSTPHPDVDGRAWHTDVNSIWQVQSSGVQGISIGTPKKDGQNHLVIVDYRAPSIRPSLPPTKFHTVWVVGESNGRAALKDIRYTVKYSQATQTGSALADMKRAQANFRAP